MVSHICRESAHSNTGSGFGRWSTGVSTHRGAALTSAAAGRLVDVSAVSVGVVLLTTGRTTSGEELTAVPVCWSSSVIGAHCVCQHDMHSLANINPVYHPYYDNNNNCFNIPHQLVNPSLSSSPLSSSITPSLFNSKLKT